MIKKILYSLSVFILLINNLVFAEQFLSSATIENSGSKKYKAIRLTAPIYNNTKDNLADIKLFDKDNEAIAYFINSYTQNNSDTNTLYEMKLINSFVKDEYYYLDYTLAAPKKDDIAATSIKVDSNNIGFAKQIELLGGYDNKAWERVQNDLIYNVEGNKKLEISFSGIKKYTHYRFKIINNLEKISFSSVWLNYNNIIRKKDGFITSIAPNYKIEEADKTTVVKLSGLKNVKIDSITLQTDSMFKRKVSFEGGSSKLLYNLSFKDTEYKDTTLELNGYKVGSEPASLIIYNQDDKPINIKKVEVKYLTDELVFDGSRAGNFTLKFGNSAATPPNYDIANYKDKIILEGYDVLEIKDIKAVPPKPIEQKSDYKWIFNIVIVVIAVIMGIIIVLKLKKNQ